MDVAVLFGLLAGDGGKVAGDGVVRLAGLADQVQGNHGELTGGAGLEEEDLIVVGHVHEPAELKLGVVEDLLEGLGAVGHLHDGHAAAAVIHHFPGCPLQRGDGKHAGAGGEIENAIVSCHLCHSCFLVVSCAGRTNVRPAKTSYH